MTEAIRVEQLVVEYPVRRNVVRALDGIDFFVPRGQVVGFLGPNGAGKTTAMHVLLGFVPARSGKAFLFDQDVRDAIARENIGYLSDVTETHRFLSGREALAFAGRLFGLRGRQLRQRIDDVLERVALSEVAHRRVGGYSRGMLQRLGLAQALINDPDLLILDEPTSGLDPLGRMRIRTLIADLRAAGKTVFFSSHELSEVERVCDRLIILARGRVVAEGPQTEVVPPNENLETFFLRVIA